MLQDPYLYLLPIVSPIQNVIHVKSSTIYLLRQSNNHLPEVIVELHYGNALPPFLIRQQIEFHRLLLTSLSSVVAREGESEREKERVRGAR